MQQAKNEGRSVAYFSVDKPLSPKIKPDTSDEFLKRIHLSGKKSIIRGFI